MGNGGRQKDQHAQVELLAHFVDVGVEVLELVAQVADESILGFDDKGQNLGPMRMSGTLGTSFAVRAGLGDGEPPVDAHVVEGVATGQRTYRVGVGARGERLETYAAIIAIIHTLPCAAFSFVPYSWV